MKKLITAAAAACAAAIPANAAIVQGTYTGTITGGSAYGTFGYAGYTDLTGLTVTGTFRYDTSLLAGDCGSSTYLGDTFYACYSGPGVTVTQSLNGNTVTFASAPDPTPGLEYNDADGRIDLYKLLADTLNIDTYSSIGSPADVYLYQAIHLGVELPEGSVEPASPGDLSGTAVGASPYGGYAGTSPYRLMTQNSVSIYELTGGFYSQDTDYSFSIDSFILAPVPEPASWAMMIGGFGLIGLSLRRRRLALA